MFNWDTLVEIGPEVLPYKVPVTGARLEVALVTGEQVQVWRSDDRRQYFCHGLTFGGTSAPGGPVSPLSGQPVETILRALYRLVPDEAATRPGDVVVWRAAPGSPEGATPHSAVLTEVVVRTDRGYLDGAVTRLRTKNGMMPETTLPLDELFALYGETIEIYPLAAPRA